MRIEADFEIEVPIARMYQELNDIEQIGYCVAGVKEVTAISADKSKWRVEVRAGFMARTFNLNGKITERRSPEYLAFSGTGQDVELAGHVQLRSLSRDRTRCETVVEATIVGPFASIVDLMAKGPQQALIQETINNLRKRLESVASSENTPLIDTRKPAPAELGLLQAHRGLDSLAIQTNYLSEVIEQHVDADVAIVGLGPVGAALAGLLGRRGISVIAIDRDRDVYSLPRAAHIDHQSLRLLQELRCLDDLMPHMIRNPGLDFMTADGEILLRIPADQSSVSGLPASMYFHQPPFDRRLRGVAGSLPSVDLRLGAEMVAIEAFTDHVRLEVVGGTGRSEIRARWVVGCDGASSSVREATGIPMTSFGFDENWVVVDLILKRPIASLPDRALNICDPARPATAIPIPSGRFRFEVMVLPGEDAAELQRPRNVLPLLAKWVPQDAVEVERSAVYAFHGLLAEAWRVGRILVAGDAAHQMPPFLGQGMNSGLRDAANLAWKISMVIRGEAEEAILDTYELERSPHVARIIAAAIDYGRLTCTIDPQAAAERDRRWREDRRSVTDRLPFSLPVLDQGPLVLEGGGELFVQPPIPDPAGRLDDVVGQRFLVVGRNDKSFGATRDWWVDVAGALVATIDELRDPLDDLERWMDRHSADVVVVRPDRYVLGAGLALDDITRRVSHFFRATRITKSPSIVIA